MSFTNPRVLKDGSVCSLAICTEVSYVEGNFTFNVTQFSVYSSEETPTTTTVTAATSSSDGGVPTYTVSVEQFQEGYTKSVGRGWKIKFDVNNETHEVKVDKLTSSTIKITVSSEPQEATLVVGDTRRFELTGDDFYDLSVRLNSIKGLRANLTIQSVYEEMSLEAVGEEGEKEVRAGEVFEEEKGDFVWIVGVIIALVVGIGYFVWKRKK